MLVNRLRQKTKAKNNEGKITGRPKTEAPSIQVAAAVCGTSSMARFPLLIRLVLCYPDCRLRPAFVTYAQPLGVRQYETGRAGSSSNHATRFLQYVLSIRKEKRKRKKKKITESHKYCRRNASYVVTKRGTTECFS